MESRFFIYVSLIVDILIAISKFIASGFTGSSSMLSEAIHSVIDAISQLLLILGVRMSEKKPDKKRPFGYGKEIYFWSSIVSLIIFLIGGCISFYQGWLRLHSQGNDKYVVNIIDITGKLVFSARVTTTEGVNLYDIDLSKGNGIYLLKIKNGDAR